MNPYYTAIAQRANHRCEYCKAPEVVFNFPFEVEHIVPLSRQGSDIEKAVRTLRLTPKMYEWQRKKSTF